MRAAYSALHTGCMAVDVLRWENFLDGEELAHLAVEPERGARFAALPEDVHADVRAAIGVDRLYVHQREVWDASTRGEHVAVTTGTASGKTLAFNLPVLDALARDPAARALYLYPTKALAQDQFRTLAGYALPRLRPAIYDGDTPIEQRAAIRRTARLVLSNPDMLHVGLLPNHDRWGDLLANLRCEPGRPRRERCLARGLGREVRDLPALQDVVPDHSCI